MNRTYSLLLISLTGFSVLNAADLKTYQSSLSNSTWTWTQTDADRPNRDTPIVQTHGGNLSSGLHSDSGSTAALLRLRTGPARIDNGMSELPPEPYKTNTGTSGLYAVPGTYTGVYGLYNGDVSAYAAAAFPNATSILMGNYTQSMVNSFHNNGGWQNSTAVEELAAFSRFDLTVTEFEEGARFLSFQIRIQGMGPTLASQASGQYLTTYDVVSQIVPLTLTVNGTDVIDLYSRELLSYGDLGVGGRNLYAGGGMEEVWEFIWDLGDVQGEIDEATISFTNYPTSVITGLAVNQLNVPEPSTYALLLGLGVAGVAVLRRRRGAGAQAVAA